MLRKERHSTKVQVKKPITNKFNLFVDFFRLMIYMPLKNTFLQFLQKDATACRLQKPLTKKNNYKIAGI